MAQIKVYTKSGTRLGSTSKAYDTNIHEELMREFTLDFSIANTDAIFKFIEPDIVFECQGEKFDITDIDDDEDSKETKISAEHVSYRLNNYNVPANYAFVGTAQEIGADILNVSGANAEFKMGVCAETGAKSFSLNNDKEITARAAIIALKNMSVEVNFSNFTINLPEMVGSVKENPLKLSRRRWQKGNGWTYEVDIADMGNITVGDKFPIISEGIETGAKRRIISYNHNPDDPSQNSVTLGVFIRDEASAAVETYDIAVNANYTANTANDTANAAKETADNSVQQGEKYSNVSIDHTNGFMATNKAGTQRVMMNGDDCFIVQVKQNGSWVTVNSLEAFGLLVDRLTSKAAKDEFYIKVGKTSTGRYGLTFFLENREGLSISSREDGANAVVFDVPEHLTINTLKGLWFTASDYAGKIDLEATNLVIDTKNILITDTDEGVSGNGFTETIKFVTRSDTGSDYVREFKVVQGILTK